MFPDSLYRPGVRSGEYDYITPCEIEAIRLEGRKKSDSEIEERRYSSVTEMTCTSSTVPPSVPARTTQMDQMYYDAKSISLDSLDSGLSYGMNVMTDHYVSMNEVEGGVIRCGSTASSVMSSVSDDTYTSLFFSDDSDEEILTTIDEIRNAHNPSQDSHSPERSELSISISPSEQEEETRDRHFKTPSRSLPDVLERSPVLSTKVNRSHSTNPTNLSIMTPPPRPEKSPILERRSPTPKPRPVPVPRPGVVPPIPVRGERGASETQTHQQLTTHMDVLPESCMIPGLARDECSKLLALSEVGTYLVRTKREDGTDAIAVLAKKNPLRIKHYIVFRKSGLLYLTTSEPRFVELSELVKHYFAHALPQTDIQLSQPL